MPFHAGLDWGGASHSVCIIDGSGQLVAYVPPCSGTRFKIDQYGSKYALKSVAIALQGLVFTP